MAFMIRPSQFDKVKTRFAWILVVASLILGVPGEAQVDTSRFNFEGGAKLGYSLGQNGQGWPKAWETPLQNLNRGGFYVDNIKARGTVRIDSALKFIAQFNMVQPVLEEAYLSAKVGDWTVRLGRFFGAGLRSATESSFSRETLRRPYYAVSWIGLNRTFDGRDYGIEFERSYFNNQFTHRFFAHNASGQNVTNSEPSAFSAPVAQILGFDYAWDWKVTPNAVLGGHMGTRANSEWDEFLGTHDFWEAQYWFKTNGIANASLHHIWDKGRLHLVSEALILENRNGVNPVDSTFIKTWGGSIFGKWNAGRYNPYGRYEFFDPTDGSEHDDALHLLTVGLSWKPWPIRHDKVECRMQYVRSLEEGFKNLVGNDVLDADLRIKF